MIRTNCQACHQFFFAPREMLNQGVNCPHCGTSVGNTLPEQPSEPISDSLTLKQQLKQFRFGFEKTEDGIQIVQKKWERGDKVPLLIIVFVSFYLLNFFVTFLIGQFGGTVGLMISTLTLVGTSLIVLFSTIYCILVHEINWTMVKIDRVEISFEDWGPLPWPKFLFQRSLPLAKVKQFFVNTIVSEATENSSRSVTDSLSVALEDDSHRRIVSLVRRRFFWSSGEASNDAVRRLLKLEKLVEDFLEIEDQKVIAPYGSTYGSRSNEATNIRVKGHSGDSAKDLVMSISLIGLIIVSPYVALQLSRTNRGFLNARRSERLAEQKEVVKQKKAEFFDDVTQKIFKRPPAEVLELPVGVIDVGLQNYGFTLKRMTDLVSKSNFRLYQPPNAQRQSSKYHGWFISDPSKETPSFSFLEDLGEHEFRTSQVLVRHAFRSDSPNRMFFVSHQTETSGPHKLPLAYWVPEHVSSTCLFLNAIIQRHELSDEILTSKELYDWILKECEREFRRETAPVYDDNHFVKSKIEQSLTLQNSLIRVGDRVTLTKPESMWMANRQTRLLGAGTTFVVTKIDGEKVWGNGLFSLSNKNHQFKAKDAAFSPDGTLVVSVGGELDTQAEVVIWDRLQGSLYTLTRKSGDAVKVGFIPGDETSGHGSFFVCDSSNRSVLSWDLANRQFRFGFRTIQRPRDMAFAADGSFLVIAESGYHSDRRRRFYGPCDVSLWNANERRRVNRFRGNEREVHAVAVSSDSQWVASAGKDKQIRIWNQKGKLLNSWTTSEALSDIVFVDSDRLIACTGHDDGVRFYSTQTGELSHTFSFSGGTGRSLALSPDQRRLACTDTSGMLRIWSLPPGELILEHQASTSSVRGVSFSPDGEMVLTAADDGVVTIWNIGSGTGVAGWLPKESLVKL